ncbi:Integrase zinc binding domain [Popillia japonica]|uniref:RNA-directed DNA polymerase n=1 Tax=Popillia japonica TaxID=7064 RepID=A0AAW1LRH5_POPJA
MTNHLKPKPSEVTERFKFKDRKQRNGETINEYVAQLKKLSLNCNFKDLEENLRDQLVCGVIDVHIKKRLLSEADLTYKKAIELATSLETTTKEVSIMDGYEKKSSSNINYNKKEEKEKDGQRNGLKCFRCNSGSHLARNCYYKNYKCKECGRIGHIARACKTTVDRQRHFSRRGGYTKKEGEIHRRSTTDKRERNEERKWRTGRANERQAREKRRKKMENRQSKRRKERYTDGPQQTSERETKKENGEQAEQTRGDTQRRKERYTDGPQQTSERETKKENGEQAEQMRGETRDYAIKTNDRVIEPIKTKLLVEQTLLEFEIDTGSNISAISEDLYCKYLKHLTVNPSDWQFKSYSGQIIPCLGFVNAKVRLDKVEKCLKLFIFKNGGPNPLLGRHWSLKLFIFKNGGPNPLLGRHWMHELGLSINNITKDDISKLTRCLTDRFSEVFTNDLGCYNKELHLQLQENCQPIFFRPYNLPYAMKDKVNKEIEQNWGTPIVPVVKHDNSIRLAGNFKLTINKCLNIDRYPIPKIEDLLNSLNGAAIFTKLGAAIFTKLDISDAYNQIKLDEQSKPLLTISTHRGLFQYQRLVYGIASAPGWFQREMEKLVQDEVYDRTCKVLSKIQEVGLTLKKSKCSFFTQEVSFLGHKVNKDGIHMEPMKVKAVTDAPIPENTKQLQAFLGTVNYESIVKTKALARSFVWWPNLDKELENIIKSCQIDNVQCSNNEIENGLDLPVVTTPIISSNFENSENLPNKSQTNMEVDNSMLSNDNNCKESPRLPVVNNNEPAPTLRRSERVMFSVTRKVLLKELHSTHLGIVKTKALARSFVWWPNLVKKPRVILDL